MNRPASLIALALLLAVGVVALALGRAAKVEAADTHKIVYVHIAGRGPAARAWYYGAPAPGVAVQDALDKFASEGLHYAGIASSGLGSQSQSSSSSSDSSLDSYVIVLER
jgi:hypothetical protein